MPDTSTTPMQYVPALLLWAAAAYKLRAVRHAPADLRIRAFWLGLVLAAGALTTIVPPVYAAFDRLVGVPNLARLLSNGLAMCAGLAVQAVMLLLDFDADTALRRLRARVWWLAGSLATMAAFFVLAPLDTEQTNAFTVVYADAPYMIEYRLVFLGFLGASAADITRLSWRYARQARRPLVALGMRLNTIGGIFGLTFVADSLVFLIAQRTSLRYPFARPEPVLQLLVFSAATFIVVGSTIPAWGAAIGIDRLLRWLRLYRAHQRLHPLWAAVVDVLPQVVLTPTSRFADVVNLRNVEFRLYRRVVEIRDGYLELRGYLDPDVAAAARELGADAGMSDERLQAAVEAAGLAVAIRNRRAGQPARAAEVAARTVGGGDARPVGGADLDSEYAWLDQVAHAYARSPIVRRIVERSGT